MWFQVAIKLIQYHAGLDTDGSLHLIEFDDLIQVPRAVDKQRFTDGLAILRSTATTGKHRDALFGCDLNCGFYILVIVGNDHTNGHELVDGGIGAIAASTEVIEENVALQFLL